MHSLVAHSEPLELSEQLFCSPQSVSSVSYRVPKISVDALSVRRQRMCHLCLVGKVGKHLSSVRGSALCSSRMDFLCICVCSLSLSRDCTQSFRCDSPFLTTSKSIFDAMVPPQGWVPDFVELLISLTQSPMPRLWLECKMQVLGR